MFLGQLLGVARLVLDLIYPSPNCGERDTRPGILSAFNFTYFSAILLVVSTLVMVILSFCTARPDYEKVSWSNNCSLDVNIGLIVITHISIIGTHAIRNIIIWYPGKSDNWLARLHKGRILIDISGPMKMVLKSLNLLCEELHVSSTSTKWQKPPIRVVRCVLGERECKRLAMSNTKLI